MRPLWAREDGHKNETVERAAQQYDFCRHCVALLQRCRWCHNAVGVHAENIAVGDWAEEFRACHDPTGNWSCYNQEWATRDILHPLNDQVEEVDAAAIDADAQSDSDPDLVVCLSLIHI